ncbi:DUF1837 domain-containing protein [Brucella endophytica]|nr:DUF1837 domain-containing protein [Brucella endophytica]
MHYHGADGVYATVAEDGRLKLTGSNLKSMMVLHTPFATASHL